MGSSKGRSRPHNTAQVSLSFYLLSAVSVGCSSSSTNSSTPQFTAAGRMAAGQLAQSIVREFCALVSPQQQGHPPWKLSGPDQQRQWTCVLQVRPLQPLCTGGTFTSKHKQQGIAVSHVCERFLQHLVDSGLLTMSWRHWPADTWLQEGAPDVLKFLMLTCALTKPGWVGRGALINIRGVPPSARQTAHAVLDQLIQQGLLQENPASKQLAVARRQQQQPKPPPQRQQQQQYAGQPPAFQQQYVAPKIEDQPYQQPPYQQQVQQQLPQQQQQYQQYVPAQQDPQQQQQYQVVQDQTLQQQQPVQIVYVDGPASGQQHAPGQQVYAAPTQQSQWAPQQQQQQQPQQQVVYQQQQYVPDSGVVYQQMPEQQTVQQQQVTYVDAATLQPVMADVNGQVQYVQQQQPLQQQQQPPAALYQQVQHAPNQTQMVVSGDPYAPAQVYAVEQPHQQQQLQYQPHPMLQPPQQQQQQQPMYVTPGPPPGAVVVSGPPSNTYGALAAGFPAAAAVDASIPPHAVHNAPGSYMQQQQQGYNAAGQPPPHQQPLPPQQQQQLQSPGWGSYSGGPQSRPMQQQQQQRQYPGGGSSGGSSGGKRPWGAAAAGGPGVSPQGGMAAGYSRGSPGSQGFRSAAAAGGGSVPAPPKRPRYEAGGPAGQQQQQQPPPITWGHDRAPARIQQQLSPQQQQLQQQQQQRAAMIRQQQQQQQMQGARGRDAFLGSSQPGFYQRPGAAGAAGPMAGHGAGPQGFPSPVGGGRAPVGIGNWQGVAGVGGRGMREVPGNQRIKKQGVPAAAAAGFGGDRSGREDSGKSGGKLAAPAGPPATGIAAAAAAALAAPRGKPAGRKNFPGRGSGPAAAAAAGADGEGDATRMTRRQRQQQRVTQAAAGPVTAAALRKLVVSELCDAAPSAVLVRQLRQRYDPGLVQEKGGKGSGGKAASGNGKAGKGGKGEGRRSEEGGGKQGGGEAGVRDVAGLLAHLQQAGRAEVFSVPVKGGVEWYARWLDDDWAAELVSGVAQQEEAAKAGKAVAGKVAA